MSVEFQHVSKSFGRGSNAHVLFEDLNFRIDLGQRIAILAQPKSGKSTLLRMICDTEHYTTGAIIRTSSVSWPLPMNDFLVPYATVAANIRFATRLYGVESEKMVREIAALVEISDYLNLRLNQAPRIVKMRLSLAMVIGIGFDICLFDDRAASVDKEFKAQAVEMIKSLGPQRSIVVATSLPKEVADVCDTAFVLDGGALIPFADLAEATEYFQGLTAKEAENQPEAPDEPEVVEDDFVLEIGI